MLQTNVIPNNPRKSLEAVMVIGYLLCDGVGAPILDSGQVLITRETVDGRGILSSLSRFVTAQDV